MVIGRDPVADQTERHRQPIDHGHPDRHVDLLTQRLGGVDAGRAGTDDRHDQRVRRRRLAGLRSHLVSMPGWPSGRLCAQTAPKPRRIGDVWSVVRANGSQEPIALS